MVGGTDNTPKNALCPDGGNLRVKAALNISSQGPGAYLHVTERANSHQGGPRHLPQRF